MNASAPPTAAHANEFDTGAPVPIGQNRWFFADGSYKSHTGFGPTVAPPPAHEIDRAIVIRRYHLEKAKLATRARKALSDWSRGHGTVVWNVAMHGPEPAASEEFLELPPHLRGYGYGLMARAKPGLERLDAIAAHHVTRADEIDAGLRARGMDQDLRDV